MHNSPKDLFTSDEIRELNGEKTKYFLKSFGKLIESPISIENQTNGALRYLFDTSQKTVLLININNKYLNFLDSKPEAQIIDITFNGLKLKPELIIKLRNPLKISLKYYINFTKCNFIIRKKDNFDGHLKAIGPNSIEKFEYYITFKDNNNTSSMNDVNGIKTGIVQVFSEHRQMISRRKIYLKKSDSCLCSIYCKCSCLSESMKCSRISKYEWNLAGFNFKLPKYKSNFSKIYIIMEIIFILFSINLLIGLVKFMISILLLPSEKYNRNERKFSFKKLFERFDVKYCFFISGPVLLFKFLTKYLKLTIDRKVYKRIQDYSLSSDRLMFGISNFNDINSFVNENSLNSKSLSMLSDLPIVFINFIEQTTNVVNVSII